jgi:integrase/recombinase XerD
MSKGNIYRRGEIWWMRATVKGVERRESLRTNDERTARKLAEKRLAEIAAAVWHGETRRSWREALTAWAKAEAGNIAPTTKRRYAVSFKQCEPYLADLDIAAIDGKAISSLVAARRAAGASSATIRRDLTAISRVLTFAEGEGWREGNPTLSKRRTIKERRDPIRLPEHVDVERIIAAASARFGAFIRAAWLTGCRQDELVRVTWRQFNPRGQTLEVIGKGNKRRTLALSSAATAHFSAQPRTLGSDLIFCHPGGLAYAQPASEFCHVRRAVEARAKREKTKFARFRFHDLRHLFAVEALREGMDIYTLSRHLGHTSVKTTEIYLEFLSPEQADSVKSGSAQNTAQLRRSDNG